uniref:Uncharacterized protein n=2 Tax=Caenorhabditis japonica TaxID=281687 RepID=A0A8R1EAL5_CAEJA
DLFGYRKKSVRRVLEETFEEEMKKAAEESVEPPVRVPGAAAGGAGAPPPVTVRYRAPTFNPPAHDIFGDAVHNIFQKLMARGQPADFCHWMAYVIAAEIDRKSRPKFQPVRFHPDIYNCEGTDAAKKAFLDGHWPAVDRILMKNAGEAPLLLDKWSGIHVSAEQMRGQR